MTSMARVNRLTITSEKRPIFSRNFFFPWTRG
jgi:hypothetical protein